MSAGSDPDGSLSVVLTAPSARLTAEQAETVALALQAAAQWVTEHEGGRA